MKTLPLLFFLFGAIRGFAQEESAIQAYNKGTHLLQQGDGERALAAWRNPALLQESFPPLVYRWGINRGIAQLQKAVEQQNPIAATEALDSFSSARKGWCSWMEALGAQKCPSSSHINHLEKMAQQMIRDFPQQQQNEGEEPYPKIFLFKLIEQQQKLVGKKNIDQQQTLLQEAKRFPSLVYTLQTANTERCQRQPWEKIYFWFIQGWHEGEEILVADPTDAPLIHEKQQALIRYWKQAYAAWDEKAEEKKPAPPDPLEQQLRALYAQDRIEKKTKIPTLPQGKNW